MDSIIANLAIARVPEPVPFVMQLFAHERSLGSRTAPEIVVNGGRRRRGRGHRTDAVTSPIHQGVGVTDRADLAAAQEIKRPAQEYARPILGAHLDHAAIFSGRRHHLLSFPQVVGKRFLDVNVLARLSSPDRRQGMPVIRQCDHHRVDRLIVEDSAEVGVSRDLFSPLRESLGLAVEMRLVHVADRGMRTRDFSNPRNELMSAPAHAPDGGG